MNATTAARLPSTQQGVVLVVALIMLLLLTIIGLAGMRSTLLEERMAGNLRDHNLAFQAAEAALREGETNGVQACLISGFNGSSGCYDLTVACQNDDAADDDASCWTGRDNPAAWANWTTSGRAPVSTIPLVDSQPRYVVERVTSTSVKKTESLKSSTEYEEVTYYRVTARGVGGNPNTVAIVQSTYRP